MLYRIGWLLLFGLLPMLGVGGDMACDTKSNEVNSTINFELHGGLMLVNATVDGQQGKYLFDSGAPAMVINREVKSKTAVFTSVRGNIDAQEALVHEVVIGSIIRKDVEAWYMDLSDVERRLGIRVDGLLGADILSNYDLLIDYKDRTMSFLDGSKFHNSNPLFTNVVAVPFESYYDNLPVVKIIIKGKTLRMSFDTGAGVSVIGEDAIEISGTTIDRLQLGLVQVQSLPFIVSDMSEFKDKDGTGIDGILSVNALNVDRVLISSQKQRIYLFWDS